MEEVLGSSDEGEGLDEDPAGCDADSSSAERTPWWSISSWVADWTSPPVNRSAVLDESRSKPRYNNCTDGGRVDHTALQTFRPIRELLTCSSLSALMPSEVWLDRTGGPESSRI